MSPSIGEIFRQYGPEYLRRHGEALLPSHRQALSKLAACRTAALGGHVWRCADCGHEDYAYHSCNHGACPACGGDKRERWITERRAELLPVPYFHLIFTVPRPIAELTRARQTALLGILFRAAADALQRLARDPRHLGGETGILAVLHTWTQTLVFHPHVHCLVPAGAVSPEDGRWIAANPKFLVPVKALSLLFRARFQALLKRTDLYARIPREVWNGPWVVYSKPAVQGRERILEYLGRYLFRVAISNSRIEAAADGEVVFRYQDRRGGGVKRMRLPALEFIRRFLQHVLPRRFVKVRYYGFWAAANRERLASLRRRLGPPEDAELPSPGELAQAARMTAGAAGGRRRCRKCGGGNVIHVAELPPVRCHSP